MDAFPTGQQSYRRGIAWSTGMSLVARGLVFLTAVAIAYRFGTTAATDVYFYCYMVVTAAVGFVTMLDSMVVIPEVMRLQVQEDGSRAAGFANAVLYGYLALALVTGALVAAFPMATVGALSRFSPEVLAANRPTILLAIPLFVAMVVGQFLIDLLTSQRYFTLPMISSAVNSLFAVTATIAFGAALGPKVILAAQTTGLLVQIAALLWLMKRRLRWRFGVLGVPRHRWFLGRAALSQAAGVAALVGTALPSYLLSGLAPGLLTALQFGQRTADLPTQVVAAPFSSVVGIKLNELAARGQRRQMDAVFVRSTQFLVSLLMPVAVLMSVYAPEVARVLYARGEFDATAAGNTSLFLGGLALVVPFLAVNTIASRLVMAVQAVTSWSWYVIGLNAALSVWIVVVISTFGASAYPAGAVVFHAASMGALYVFMRRYHPGVSAGKGIGVLLQLLPPTALMAAVLACSRILLSPLPGWVAALVGGLVYGGAVVLFPTRFLVFPDAREALGGGGVVERARRLLAAARG
jgi:peptidoglycan biosynthesis protein MviN/MurJ (putative lipid II flippase)